MHVDSLQGRPVSRRSKPAFVAIQFSAAALPHPAQCGLTSRTTLQRVWASGPAHVLCPWISMLCPNPGPSHGSRLPCVSVEMTSSQSSTPASRSASFSVLPSPDVGSCDISALASGLPPR